MMKALELTKLEFDVTEKILDGDTFVLSELRKQFQSAEILSREYTGAGFFIKFSVPSELRIESPNVKRDFSFGDVEARIPLLSYGAGFLLWVSEGLISQLEGYTYGENWTPEMSTSEDYTLFYFLDHEGDGRNLVQLKQSWTPKPT